MDERRTNKHLHKTPEEYMGCKPSTHQNKKDKSTAMKAGTLMVGNQEEKRLHGTLNDEKIKDECVTAIEVEKHACKPRGRKKKRKCQNSQGKVEIDPSLDKVNTSGLKTNTSQAILSPSTYISNEKRSHLTSRKCFSSLDNKLKKPTVNNVAVTTGGKDALADSFLSASATSEASESTVVSATDQTEDDASKERLLSNSEGERQATEMQPKKQKSSTHKKSNNLRLSEETFHRKSYSAIVKERIQNQHRAPKILLNIHTVKMADASENICLCCQFSGVSTDCFIVWTKEETVLVEEKISTGDKSESSFTIAHASCKDLGWYECCLRSPQGEASQKFHLTSDVLNELVPCHNQQVHNSKEVGEDVKCAPLLFKEDFLSEQFFGKEQPASILTEEVHFGEGMHRKAFRAKVLAGLMPLFNPGHHCVLKVHNAISYGAKNNEELIQKNYNLAIEECYVQNTAREYIKAYTAVAKSAEIFGEVPEIIPIYLVHRPTSDIPYATLEEELVGEFVKYSVKDGKEMNLMRRDSEAGQKCCAFQHWVYHITEGNLLVTDMQGVGMKLTDVGIATCKKGYKGFRGNCATSFIDQFKALHQCNKFCQLLGLKSLQAFQQPSKRAAPATQLKAKSSPRNASTPVLKSEC